MTSITLRGDRTQFEVPEGHHRGARSRCRPGEEQVQWQFASLRVTRVASLAEAPEHLLDQIRFRDDSRAEPV